MSASIKPIKVWGQGGANPPKIAILLEELCLPYDIIPVKLSEVKNPEYIAINPNGRIPSIHDPNTGITVWESGAIIEYLIDLYDKEHLLSFTPGSQEYYHAKQWLFFQATGQGPYYGQAAWFKKFHAEKIPSALDRYAKEVNRVSSVLDVWLSQQAQEHGSKTPWLVGNKLSYADIAFIPYQVTIGTILSKDEYNVDNFPHLKDWLGEMTARTTVKTVLDVAFRNLEVNRA